MPEFIACPACGCRVQMLESAFGKSVRCIACDHRFIVSPPAETETRRVEPLPARERPPGAEWRSVPAPRPLPPDDPDDDRPPRDSDLPCCPACGWRVPWEALRCGQCGVELEVDGGYDRFRQRPAGRLRRDCVPHRGALLSAMGAFTLIAGGLTLCLFGVPLLVTLPLGITTWLMAAGDLEKMRAGEMDDRGRGQTESGRTCAAFGVVLSLFFGGGWGLMFLSRMLP
jgi:hypothetical protein